MLKAGKFQQHEASANDSKRWMVRTMLALVCATGIIFGRNYTRCVDATIHDKIYTVEP